MHESLYFPTMLSFFSAGYPDDMRIRGRANSLFLVTDNGLVMSRHGLHRGRYQFLHDHNNEEYGSRSGCTRQPRVAVVRLISIFLCLDFQSRAVRRDVSSGGRQVSVALRDVQVHLSSAVNTPLSLSGQVLADVGFAVVTNYKSDSRRAPASVQTCRL